MFEKKMIESVEDDIEDGWPYELKEDDITVELQCTYTSIQVTCTI